MAEKAKRDAVGPVIEHDNMTGDRLYRALAGLDDGGMSTVAVIRDGRYWPVRAVYMNPDRFVILELSDTDEGPVGVPICGTSGHPTWTHSCAIFEENQRRYGRGA